MVGIVQSRVVVIRWRGLALRLAAPRLPPLPRSRQQAIAMAYCWSAFALLNLADEAALLAMMFC